MIRGGFLDPSMRADLIALIRDGKAETRLTRRANALLLLDDGMSCEGRRRPRDEPEEKLGSGTMHRLLSMPNNSAS